ncbi:hypothetical protein GY45DRAFT_350198 [Cubamyces sp. BRFM 1775]|nr:hypothetical protein GY45DRAFT_350198 [Cubamyces sp. BRFM 1775]
MSARRYGRHRKLSSRPSPMCLASFSTSSVQDNVLAARSYESIAVRTVTAGSERRQLTCMKLLLDRTRITMPYNDFDALTGSPRVRAAIETGELFAFYATG